MNIPPRRVNIGRHRRQWPQGLTALQINTNRSRLSLSLAEQMAAERGCNVMVTAEPPVGFRGRNVFISEDGGAAIVVMEGSCSLVTRGTSHVSVRSGGVLVVAAYISPNCTQDTYARKMQEIAIDLQGGSPTVLAGDFNAWARAWGSRKTTVRGDILMDTVAQAGLVVLNRGNTPTFRRTGTAGSVVDVTFASEGLFAGHTWEVAGDLCHSDHLPLLWSVDTVGRSETTTRPVRWREDTFSEEAFRTNLALADQETPVSIARAIRTACGAAMRRQGPTQGNRRNTYWWSQELTALRTAAGMARRIMKRAHPDVRDRLVADYNAARGELKWAIRRAKRNAWEALISELDEDPWGRPYRLLIKKLRLPLPDITAQEAEQALRKLFPHRSEAKIKLRDAVREATVGVAVDPRRDFTTEEVRQAALRTPTGKAPGPDNIPGLALKRAVQLNLQAVTAMLNGCVAGGVFPEEWKRQEVVLIPKKGSGYRPICLINGMGKLMERLLLVRLNEAIEASGGLSALQFGFRTGKSTLDALEYVVGAARVATRGPYGRSGFALLVALDIANAFNTIRWEAIILALAARAVPAWLLNCVASFLQGRTVWHRGSGREQQVQMGVPQGSVLGPVLWNIAYDGLLRSEMPPGVEVVAYADDILLVVSSKTVEDAKLRATLAYNIVRDWTKEQGLKLAPAKTEALLISRRKKVVSVRLELGGRSFVSTRGLKYLGVTLDDRLSFTQHVSAAVDGVEEAVCRFCRALPNLRGPKPQMRRLISVIIRSRILYGAPVWASALRYNKNRRLLEGVYRRIALRVASCYRTVSVEASLIISGVRPPELEIERMVVRRQGAVGQPPTRGPEWWQQRWNESAKGAWTREIIPDIGAWDSRGTKAVNYRLSQMLSGHGAFKAYLHRFGLRDNPYCPECPGNEETARHVLCDCPRFEVERHNFSRGTGIQELTGAAFGRALLDPGQARSAQQLAESIITTLEAQEEDRRRVTRAN